jgi:hypothetical protein
MKKYSVEGVKIHGQKPWIHLNLRDGDIVKRKRKHPKRKRPKREPPKRMWSKRPRQIKRIAKNGGWSNM